MPKYTPTKDVEFNNARELPTSPVSYQKTGSPMLMSPSSVHRIQQQKLQAVSSRIEKSQSPKSSPTHKRVSSSPSIKKLFNKVLRSPTSEKKKKRTLNCDMLTSPTKVPPSPSKKNIIARKLFPTKATRQPSDESIIEADTTTNNDFDTCTDMKTDFSYFPSMVSSDGEDSDDDATGKSYMCYSDDEDAVIDGDLIDTFGLDIPTKFTPVSRRKSNLNSARKKKSSRLEEIAKADEDARQRQMDRKHSLQQFLKARLQNWKKEAIDKKKSAPELESKIPDMFQALNDDQMSVADAIIREWELKQSTTANE
jgi:hypothetical protein